MKDERSYLQMMTMARALVNRLAPVCERIEIAGSLRRRKPLVGDIEIVAIPRPILNLLGEPSGQTEVDAMLATWPITLIKNGAKYKQFTFTGNSGQSYQIDLFLPDADTWGVIYMMRTGSHDFSKQMVTRRAWGGYMPDDLNVKEGRVWRGGVALDTPQEADVFALWGMNMPAPHERTGDKLLAALLERAA